MRSFLLAIVLAVGAFEVGHIPDLHWLAIVLYCCCIVVVLGTAISPGGLRATLRIDIDRKIEVLIVGFLLAVTSFELRPAPDARWIGNIAFWVTVCAVVAGIFTNRDEPSDVR
ncbi:MAG: hypothetical protein ABSE64_07480 [Vulcanimicrobiaceae bacterium]|jgi:hypothetical protein